MAPPSLKKDQGGKALRFNVNGVDYAFRESEFTGKLERELYGSAGLTWIKAVQAAQDGALFGVAALIWLARRQAGQTVDYEVVESELYADAMAGDLTLTFEDVDADGGDDAGPPADGAN